MASVLYSGAEFPQQGILVEESLYETLYRLQEAHWGLRESLDIEVDAAIDWLRTRIVQPSPQLEWQHGVRSGATWPSRNCTRLRRGSVFAFETV